jgi:transcriptional regulator with XRE-family HTH domain
MARPTISKEQEERGRRLAAKIKASRGTTITQEQLAQMAGVPLDTLRRLERGVVAAPSIFLISDLATALGEEISQWLE